MRVYTESGRYYYALGPGVETPLLQKRGALTWRYDGQQVFKDEPRAQEGGWSDPEDSPTSPTIEDGLDEYFGVGRELAVDGQGRRWILHSVDKSELDLRRHYYRQRVFDQFGRPESTVVQKASQRSTTPRGRREEPAFHRPDRLSENSCGQLVNSDYPMTTSGHPFNDRARKVVDLWTDCGQGGGSGTMVDDRHILTAAHVILDDDGDYLDPDKTMACAYGNCSEAGEEHPHEVRCYSVGWTHVRSTARTLARVAGTDWDYGIVTFNDIITGSYRFGWMALATSDYYLASASDHHRGYPGDTPSCTSNSACPSTVVTDLDLEGCSSEFDPNNSQQYYAFGDVTAIWTGQVEFNTSTGPGMSGAPHYHCPTGDCDDGHYLTAVHSAHTTTYSEGPKANSFDTWVDGYTFNYV